MADVSRLTRTKLIRDQTGIVPTMSSALDTLSPVELGERLRTARDSAKVTQAAAAGALDVARTTLVAMEQGQRRVKLDELQKLAKLYGTSLNALLRMEAVHVDLKPQFRQTGDSGDSEIDDAVDLMTRLVKAEVELENLLGVQRARNYPPERPLRPGDVVLQAEQDAARLRHWLGLGIAPAKDLPSLLELDLGIRVYVRRLAPKISGLYAYDEAVGACILLNASHRRSRRTQSAAHELGHFVATRRAADAFQDETPDAAREEKYANAFGRAFLTPPEAVQAAFKDVTAGASQLSRRHVILLAHMFDVSREAMVRRLEELGLIKPGSWDWFEVNGGITNEQARQVLGEEREFDPAKVEADQPISFRLALLASQAWRRDLLSEAQLARLLLIDRIEVRKLINQFESEGEGTDAAPELRA